MLKFIIIMETFVLHHTSAMGVFYYIAKYENVGSFISEISKKEGYKFSEEDFQSISLMDLVHQKIGTTSSQVSEILSIEWDDKSVKINSEEYTQVIQGKDEHRRGWIIYIDGYKLESLYCYTCWKQIFDDIIKYLK